MNSDAAFGLLGLAARAGEVVSGMDACLETLRKKKAFLALTDPVISPDSLEKFRAVCAQAGVPHRQCPEMGRAIGKPGRKIAVITQRGFAQRLVELLQTGNDTEHGGGVKHDKTVEA